MGFSSILDVEKELVQITTKATKKQTERGCDHCPQNNVKGVKKIFNKVRGRKIMIFTSAPGPKENEEGKTLYGTSGDFLFDELEKVGISHKDCDIQNAIRCYPADRKEGSLVKREPKKEEIHCCSKYTEEALEKSEAKIYLLLGAVTHKAVLGKEYKKSKKIFWSETLQAKVYCLAHPNYFLGGHAPQIALDEFRDALKALNSDMGGKLSQYAYIEKQDYTAVKTIADAKQLRTFLQVAASKGIRPGVDIEHDTVNGRKLWLSIAFSTKPGTAKCLILDHPKARKINGKWVPLHSKVRRVLHKIARDILVDITIAKAFHHGSSDVPFIETYDSNTRVKGYDYDTEYAEFLAHPDRRAYGLANIGLQRYPQFGDFKTVILPECITPGTNLEEQPHRKKLGKTYDLQKLYEYVGKNDLMHFSNLPLKKLVLRNCADADLTKRIELSTKKKINHALLGVYKDAGFVLAEMEPNGPDFDYEQCEKLKKIFPPKFEAVRDKLRLLAGSDTFNPGAPKQVQWLLFKHLKVPIPDIALEQKRGQKKATHDKKTGRKFERWELASTGKAVMELLSRKYDVAKYVIEYRKVGKIISTYIKAYEMNANLHEGRLRTKWWLTGTRTGRLSSGGDKQVKESKNEHINLQNIHGDERLQNLAAADKGWRKLFKALQRAAEKVCNSQLVEITRLIEKSKATTNKEKQKSYNDALHSAIEKLKLRLYNSNKWKRLCEIVVEKYGHIRILLGYDQGQIEVRVMGQASGDKNLIKDCMSGDIHSKVGHRMTGWAVEKIKKDKKTRTLTKNIHFGILFGLSAAGLMAFILLKDPDSTITEEEAQRLYDNYFKEYPGVRRFITAMREFVEEHGYVENMFGFRRPLKSGSVVDGYEKDEESDEDEESGAFWGNQAINTPVQGAAHMLMLMAVATLKRKRKKYKPLGVPTLEVHDYIGWKTRLRDFIKAYTLGKELLEKEPLRVVKREWPNIKWLVPLVVEGKVGFRYGDSVECEEDGKVKEMHHILADMFIETFVKETKLEVDLRMVA